MSQPADILCERDLAMRSHLQTPNFCRRALAAVGSALRMDAMGPDLREAFHSEGSEWCAGWVGGSPDLPPIKAWGGLDDESLSLVWRTLDEIELAHCVFGQCARFTEDVHGDEVFPRFFADREDEGWWTEMEGWLYHARRFIEMNPSVFVHLADRIREEQAAFHSALHHTPYLWDTTSKHDAVCP